MSIMPVWSRWQRRPGRIGPWWIAAPATLPMWDCVQRPLDVPQCTPMLDATCVVVVSADATSRAPANHRPSGAACPQQRAQGSLGSACNYDAGPPVQCLRDSDCSTADGGSDAGRQNGRCLPMPGVTCATTCSYDECFADTDCAGVPCQCRPSSGSSVANVCLTGSNCRVDGDCEGGTGYCSPSGVEGTCAIAYYCHTPTDTCQNDSDCPSGQGCNYDPHAAAWACTAACLQP